MGCFVGAHCIFTRVCDICSDLADVVIGPLQDKMDEWRKAAVALDKDHAKGDFAVFVQ